MRPGQVPPLSAEGNEYSADAQLTPDGRYIVFNSAASNLVPGDTNRLTDLFMVDLAR